MKKSNLNGMTLVEVIIAMCILGAIAGMFVTVAVAAKKKNADTYIRSNEMYEQAAAAESFSTDTDYGVNVKVSKLLANGSTDNEFSIVADFKSISFNSKAYGYMARRRDVDTRDTNYQLRFFRSENTEIATPNPAAGEYWIKVVNHTGVPLRLKFIAQSGTFYSSERESLGPDAGIKVADERQAQVGYCIGDGSDLFTLCDWQNESTIIASFDESNFTDYMETKDGHVTGIVIIHICEGLEIKTDEQYKAG